ncbi:hypothetical protein [Exiguobacterium sp. s150]|uniref:hypothetical protein n=1 Tax=Exiguobacterium sp. s150 TaxID=2751221 RepID=UPI001BE9898B|nr:hypothetical protein [Exiguobacterium sp. s150]
MKRFQLESKTLVAFMYDIRVRCPQCEQRADIVMKESLRLSCLACGYGRVYTEGVYRTGGGAFDPFFRLSLYLQTNCCGHVLWAYNRDHLAYMRAYVEADIRTSDGENSSVESRLPKWMKQKHNREDVLRAIKRLEVVCEKG